MLNVVEAHAPAVARQVITRIAKLKADRLGIAPVWGDIGIAYLAASHKIPIYAEPAIDANGGLQPLAPTPGEKRSDFAFWIQGSDERPISLEIKSPEVEDIREQRIFDVIKKRVAEIRAKGEAHATVDIHAHPALLSVPGGELGSAVKAIILEIKTVTQGPEPADWNFPRRTVTYKGSVIAEVGRGPGSGFITTSSGIRGTQIVYPVEDLVDRGQLARNVPNVMVIYLEGQLTPLPPTVINGFRAQFNDGHLRRVSAGLVYASPTERYLILNPGAEIPLHDSEAKFLVSDHIPPPE